MTYIKRKFKELADCFEQVSPDRLFQSNKQKAGFRKMILHVFFPIFFPNTVKLLYKVVLFHILSFLELAGRRPSAAAAITNNNIKTYRLQNGRSSLINIGSRAIETIRQMFAQN